MYVCIGACIFGFRSVTSVLYIWISVLVYYIPIFRREGFEVLEIKGSHNKSQVHGFATAK